MTTKKWQPAKYIVYLFLIVLSALCLAPFWLMLVNATRSGNEIMTSFSFFPGTATGQNWVVVQENLDIWRGFANSLLLSVCNTVLVGYFSAITAYAFAFYEFRGKNLLFTIILVMMMVPGQLSLLGFYDLVNSMGLVNSYVPLIIPSIASSGTVFFLRQYIASVLNKAILEAPRIDGAGEFVIFHKIVLPIMLPGIATMSIGAFIGSWNSYLLPLVLLNTPSKFPLPVMVGSLRSVKNIISNIGATYLTVAISVVPVIIVFMFFSKYIISSISAGSVKE